jgi:hypothetical protein
MAFTTPVRVFALGGLAATWLALTACNQNGDRFFPEIAVPDVYILEGKDGGDVVPADITSIDDIRANTIYAEVGPARTTGYGGVTFEIVGTGNPVCLWVDPEVAFWSEAIAARPSEADRKWAYPDNVFDDGDIDLFAGLSVYYTGSPGESIGDFVVQYEDSLGNLVPVSLAACPNRFNDPVGDPASGGRGSPDWCTLPTTELGVSYTVLLRTWSTPLDDDRLAFGLLVANGDCDDVKDIGFGDLLSSLEAEECVITGEAIKPTGTDQKPNYGPWYGFGEVRDLVWENSIDFEQQFCLAPSTDDRSVRMSVFCDAEAERMESEGRTCEREVISDEKNRCFCGDPERSPSPGGS